MEGLRNNQKRIYQNDKKELKFKKLRLSLTKKAMS